MTYLLVCITYPRIIILLRDTRHLSVASLVLNKKKADRNANVFVCISGMSGDVAINWAGNRIPVFVFSNRQNGRLIPIVEIDQTKLNNESVTINNITTIWPNGVTTVPRDAPKCGFQGEKCLTTPEGKTKTFKLLI